MLQLCIVFYKYKDSRLYNDDFATLHTNKCKGKCSLYICKQEKRDIGVAFIFLLNQISTLRDYEKQWAVGGGDLTYRNKNKGSQEKWFTSFFV